ncbi:hypothetical protein LWI29_016521 [Acer saccharum]|uniref:F-box domain-containing protein n=1 Tax=Acer saccharum TaxID=4024 RepID=A0AA39VY26_ACESA|nr:hypothetical protein LWI29_016521 [Acer saccharum]
MSKVPLDVVTDMFYRLPVKTLLRFRCLSKVFCSLIDSPDFVKLHLNHTVSTKTHLVLVLKGLHLYTADLDSLDEATPFDHYPEYIWGVTEVFGSCNGLIALSNSEKDISLLNPATKQMFNLPVENVDLPKKDCFRGFVFYGFGYDFVHDDYKIVRMVQFKKDKDDDLGIFLDYEVKVYSLKTNSWRKVVNLPNYLRLLFQFYYHLLHRRGYAVFASGVLHWVFPRRAELGIGDSLVGFDLGAEEFRVVPEPDYGDLEQDFVLDVGTLEGCLCVICNYARGVVDFWVMKEYGVKESWTKLFSIEQSRMTLKISFLKPLAYSKGSDGGDEKILMELNNRKIVWFDLKRKRFKTVRINGGPDSFGTDIYVESLIPPSNGSCRIRGKKQQGEEEKKKQNKKKRDDFLSKGFNLVL